MLAIRYLEFLILFIIDTIQRKILTNIRFCVVIPENKPCLRKFSSAAVLKGNGAHKKAFVYHGAGKRELETYQSPPSRLQLMHCPLLKRVNSTTLQALTGLVMQWEEHALKVIITND